MEKEGQLYSGEGEPHNKQVVVDFLRHGETNYTDVGRDLTAKGESQITEAAQRIVETIDPEKDVVVLWSSPARRAQGSEEILKELLAEKGVEIRKESEISSLRNFDQKNKEFVSKMWPELKAQGKSPEEAFARDPIFQEESDKFESQPEVRERAGRVFNWIRYIAEHAQLQGKRLRIIGVSHSEILNPVMEDIFGRKIEEGNGVKNGEDLRISFDYDQVSHETDISAEFRGEQRSGITFDKKKRVFVAQEKKDDGQ
ncbi:MAG: phosphoglycerate mutase family protein [Minisyncoccia bacterium]|jgi:broad specificity phosphatase PhoE